MITLIKDIVENREYILSNYDSKHKLATMREIGGTETRWEFERELKDNKKYLVQFFNEV